MAVISVAAVGLMMLSGRVDLRRGASVILGCFILLGASSIAAGIQSVAQGDSGAAYTPVPREVPPRPAPPPPAANPDPFAGAAVPTG